MSQSYITPTQIQDVLNVPAHAVPLLQGFADEATAWIDFECGREAIIVDDVVTVAGFEVAARTEYFSGDGQDQRVLRSRTLLVPRNVPIDTVTSLHDDAARAYGAATEIAAATDSTAGYVLMQGPHGQMAIRLDGVVFACGIQNIRLISSGGHTVVPARVTTAALLYVAALKLDLAEAHLMSISGGGTAKTMREDPEGWIKSKFLYDWAGV